MIWMKVAPSLEGLNFSILLMAVRVDRANVLTANTITAYIYSYLIYKHSD